jgi:hypothetical protein
MVWQKDKVAFLEFFDLFLPSLVNWLVPAILMHFAISASTPPASASKMSMKPGATGVIVLFACTIATAVAFRNFLGLQPALGMMLGLGYLQMWSYFLQQKGKRTSDNDMVLNSFAEIQRVEWDTLLFFFGIIFAVGGLGVLGYLAAASETLYFDHGPRHVPWPMAARDINRRDWWQPLVNWFCRWSSPDGPRPWTLHIHESSALDMGDCGRLRSVHHCAHALEQVIVLSLKPPWRPHGLPNARNLTASSIARGHLQP